MGTLRTAHKSAHFALSGDKEGREDFTVDLDREVRLAWSEGMSPRHAVRHFNISRANVAKIIAFSVPPGYRRTVPGKRPKRNLCVNNDAPWCEICPEWRTVDQISEQGQVIQSSH